MKKYICSALFLFVFLCACGEKPAPPAEIPDTQKTLAAYAGSYNGIMPCDGCQGIDTELMLNADGTFSLIEFFLSAESDLYLTEGRWELSPTNSHVILKPSDSEGNSLDLFFAMRGRDVIKLDSNLNPLEPALDYTLRRKGNGDL